jgi:hypothetical protein
VLTALIELIVILLRVRVHVHEFFDDILPHQDHPSACRVLLRQSSYSLDHGGRGMNIFLTESVCLPPCWHTFECLSDWKRPICAFPMPTHRTSGRISSSRTSPATFQGDDTIHNELSVWVGHTVSASTFFAFVFFLPFDGFREGRMSVTFIHP